jgi:hypothetical protein
MATSILRWAAGLVAGTTLLCVNSRAADPVQAAFGVLGVFYVDQPTTRKDLDNCFRSNDKGCLSVVAGERRAVLTIFDHGPKVALDRVLNVLGRECGSLKPHASDTDPDGPTCVGAINSFYLFSTDAEDRRILDRLRSLPESTLWNVFVECHGFASDWIMNRPDKGRWLALIDDLKLLDRTPEGRAGFKNGFQHPPAELTTFMDLVDPRVDLPKWQAERLGVAR